MNLETLLRSLELKDEERVWIELFGIENGESVADHSWGVAFLSLLFSESKDLNQLKTLKMALIHDLAEVETGDIISRNKDENRDVSKEEKERREAEAWHRLRDEFGLENLYNYWEEYSEKKSEEAKFVKDMDLLELCIQAVRYEAEDRYDREKLEELPENFLEGVFSNSEKRLQTQEGEKLFRKIKLNYERAKKGEEFQWEDEKLGLAYKALKLKDETRTGWQLRGVENPESVADHCWDTAFLTMMLYDGPDLLKALKTAIIHDIAEIQTGDVVTEVEDYQKLSKKEKRNREHGTVEELGENVNLELEKLWRDYDNRGSREAVFVKEMDKIDMVLQALKYEKENQYDPETVDHEFQDLREFFQTAKPKISTETGNQLFNEIRNRYEKARQE